MKLFTQGREQQEEIPQSQSKRVEIVIKNMNRSIQDMSLTVPVNWTFGQLMYIVHQNHSQLKNYKFAGLKFIYSGSYVDEEDQIQKYQKINQKEMVLHLKVDMSVSDQVAEIQQQKIKLNQKYAVNLLWESYVEKISPFANNPQDAIQNQSLQKQKLEIEMMSSVYPLLHQQTEAILQTGYQQEQNKQTEPQRIQNQDNQQQDLVNDNFLARNIPIMFSVYFLVISKFDGPVYYVLIGILFIYFFIKYQDHKHKMNQIRERQEAPQRQQNQQPNNGIQPNVNNLPNNNTNNNGENVNLQNTQNNDSINIEDSANNTQNQKNQQQNQKQNIENNVNIQQEAEVKNDRLNLEQRDQLENKSSSQNLKNENIQIDESKEINIQDNTNYKNEADQIQDKNVNQQQVNQPPNQMNNQTKKNKKQSKGLVLFILRVKEFVYCFVMSLFPLWYVDLYNKNHKQNEEADDNKEQGQVNADNQNQQAQQQGEEQNLNQGLEDNRNQNDNGPNQNERNDQPQNGGLLEKLNNYLEKKLKDLEEEEKQLKQTIKDIQQQQQEEDNLNQQDSQDNEQKNEQDKKND